jgi:hypothetical protein
MANFRIVQAAELNKMSSMAEELEKKNAELEEMKRVSIIVLD